MLSWIQENVKPQLLAVKTQAQSWVDLQAVLTEHGLTIQPRGAGLVIALADGSLAVKASSVDRGLSFKSLTQQLGDYEPPKALLNDKKVEQGYQRKPRQAHPEANSLYNHYLKEKEAAYQARKAGLNQLRAESALFYQQTKAWYAQRRAEVKANQQLNNRSKRSVYQDLAQRMKQDLGQHKAEAAAQKQHIQQTHPALTWDEWLVQKAEEGNTQALAILRNRKRQRARLAQALLTVENWEEAKTVIQAHQKPKALKNGDMLYRLKDGGVVLDDTQAIRVPEVTEASTVLALSLADERFHGKSLVVEGSNEFKLLVAKQAALEGLSIRFADPVLEKDRQMYARARELAQQEGKAKSPGEELVQEQGQLPKMPSKGKNIGRER